ncbi:hypothetical protein [Chengkuizengella marina]|uniref:Uncharacterized protein n=1 Tax=Chengkuizengella marina TaxID=2507566 RepID=A0A6N9Q518_9BACL|nr:hypothetical protein [Chengkuizengella marina]NBI29949.1 hypothetical protein [Chengkuizengella marina]
MKLKKMGIAILALLTILSFQTNSLNVYAAEDAAPAYNELSQQIQNVMDYDDNFKFMINILFTSVDSGNQELFNEAAEILKKDLLNLETNVYNSNKRMVELRHQLINSGVQDLDEIEIIIQHSYTIQDGLRYVLHAVEDATSDFSFWVPFMLEDANEKWKFVIDYISALKSDFNL